MGLFFVLLYVFLWTVAGAASGAKTQQQYAAVDYKIRCIQAACIHDDDA
jgi:hypothetical protein